MTTKTTIDPLEIAKFAQHAALWWDLEGPLKTLHDINPARLQFIEKLTSLRGQRVLDVGCGGGVLCEAMAMQGALVSGIDAEHEAIMCARAHALQSDLVIEYECVPIESFDAELFPIITCMEMLEHVVDPELVISRSAQLLAPGGYLFLSTINRTVHAYGSVVVAAEYILGLLPRQTHDYQKFIKPSELAAMARRFGLEPIAISGLSYHPFTRHAMLQDSVSVNYLMACQKLVC